jgi:hypothetical protein
VPRHGKKIKKIPPPLLHLSIYTLHFPAGVLIDLVLYFSVQKINKNNSLISKPAIIMQQVEGGGVFKGVLKLQSGYLS